MAGVSTRMAGPLLAAALVAASGCRRAVSPLVETSSSAVALTGGPGTSMVYLARTGAGVVAIDLGWWGGERAFREALASLGATPDSVRHVFLTHSHRDHIGLWRLVVRSRFHVAAPERDALVGGAPHAGRVPRLVERLKRSDLPSAGAVEVHTFSADTSFVLGADTLHAYIVPGHTAGSAVYLFRGTLFLGDAVTWTPWGGFAPARGIYSDDRPRAVESLAALWERLPADAVRYACTAHAHCRPFTSAFSVDASR